MNSKDLEELFDNVLTRSGFRRRRDTWYSTNEDTITLVNIQKSQWSGQYYVNLGVYLRDLGKATSPLEYQAHIRARLDVIALSDGIDLTRALDLEASWVTQERRKCLEEALTMIAVPFLSARNVLPRLREMQKANSIGAVIITAEARQLLQSP
ncbi:MAG TPA: DUF4304 domain-containing protein [Gemmatimonadaceae bacterium]|jgi:hypothetical protein